jgi:hypothetical protein
MVVGLFGTLGLGAIISGCDKYLRSALQNERSEGIGLLSCSKNSGRWHFLKARATLPQCLDVFTQALKTKTNVKQKCFIVHTISG